ncbi:MAG: UDP-N-acetylmuramyl-tripeptide synthetase [Candidatus Gribaldobacteria bacterium]|nr:UDP-N-acetylmuramyl-tripeptide synthetase [Candidatus Gribaldobacteria bacterium]
MMAVKKIIRKIVPARLISTYHFVLAYLASFWYGFPSKEMVVIGVTGTKGKTSTCNFIWSTLTAGGFRVGLISTANIKIGSQEYINNFHMTMPGRFVLQKLLYSMVKAGCKMCVVETSSEGIKQFRHKGIAYDVMVFTNLSPEHLPSHNNSFEKYQEAKGKVFAELNNGKRKIVEGIEIKKVIVGNFDDPKKDYFLNFTADQKITFGFLNGADYQGQKIKASNKGVDFQVKLFNFHLNTLGEFNVYNALPAIALAEFCNINPQIIQQGLERVRVIPGRMEKIEVGQDFMVLVDYAHEQKSMTAVLGEARKIIAKGAKVIVLLGAEGGGRDKNKRQQMGEASGRLADYVVVSNVDPYDDDPLEIVTEVAFAVRQTGKVLNQNLFTIVDRREGIKKALSLAKAGDVVILTGKGAEQCMFLNTGKIAWDDREVAREEIKKMFRL